MSQLSDVRCALCAESAARAATEFREQVCTTMLETGSADGRLELALRLSSTRRRANAGAVLRAVDADNDLFVKLKPEPGFRFVPIEFSNKFADYYLPCTLTNEDYPNLIPAGETVDTIASGTILFAFNWPRNSDRYRRVDKFVQAFFSKFAELQKPPRHPKWRATNLASDVPGWKRFPGAEEWLANYREQVMASRRKQFEEFIADRSAGRTLISDQDRNRLFEDFLKWSQARDGR